MPDPIAFNSVTPRLSLPLLFSAQAHKELIHNEALSRIDTLLHTTIEGESSDPPENPSEGESWLIVETATGTWSGREKSLATFQNGGWQYTAPRPGLRIFNHEKNKSCFS